MSPTPDNGPRSPTLAPELFDRALPPGSAVQLSVLFAPVERRATLRLLYALRGELHRTALQPQEGQVAALRLRWWRDEIERFQTQLAEHPLSRALQHEIDPAVAAPYLLELLEGAAAERFAAPCADLVDLGTFCFRSFGSLQVLVAGACGDDITSPQRPAARFGRHLGNAARLVELIRDAARDAARGCSRLPRDLLERHNVERGQFATVPMPPGCRAALADLADTATIEFNAATRQLEPDMRARQRAGLVLAALYRRLLQRLHDRDFALGERPVELGAVRSLWIAWRAARASVGAKMNRTPWG